MYNIIPLVLILISLSVIIVITIKKFPILANLDVENIPREKEAKFKEKIISGRLKRNIIQRISRLSRLMEPASRAISDFFQWIYGKLHELKDMYGSQETLPEADELLTEANQLIRDEEFDEAEKLLIRIINVDNQHIGAFKALGELYFKRRSFEEARQTLEHVIKLGRESNGEVYFDLSLVNREMGDLKEADYASCHAGAGSAGYTSGQIHRQSHLPPGYK